jgi:hypothetical protein
VIGSLAYVADSLSGVQIVNVSNPADPRLHARYNTPGSARSIEFAGNLLYVGDDNGGLQILRTSVARQWYMPLTAR